MNDYALKTDVFIWDNDSENTNFNKHVDRRRHMLVKRTMKWLNLKSLLDRMRTPKSFKEYKRKLFKTNKLSKMSIY